MTRPRPQILPAFVFAIALAPPIAAQSADELFSGDVLHDVHLFINSRDLQQMRSRVTENVFYPADLHWRNLRVRNVGVRIRGGASRSATKPGLLLEFDRYTTGQRFLGLQSLVLDNLWQDSSMIKEYVSMAFFRRLGHPAPRESFARVYINRVDHGVYAIVEAVDAGFLSRHFDDQDGYLFEYRILAPFHGEYLGEDFGPYGAHFEPRTHRLEPDAVLYGPLRDLFAEVNRDDTLWRERVDAYLDLDQLVTQAAIEAFLSDADGLAGYWGMNNFYLFRAAGSPRHRVLPWDKDLTFDTITSDIFLHVHDNEILRRALSYSEYRARYLETLEQCARVAAEGWLAAEMGHALALVSAATYSDPVKPDTNESFEAAAAFLLRFAGERGGFVLSQVQAARRAHLR
jgi:spore coat protein CotH